MQASNIPVSYQFWWGQDASASYIRTPPQTTSSDPNAASFEIGFPPNTFVLPASGGAPPDGRDVNGALGLETQWTQWFKATAGQPWDGTFSGYIGGYPKGAVVAGVVNFSAQFLCTADNNASNPESSPSNWTQTRRLISVTSYGPGTYSPTFDPACTAIRVRLIGGAGGSGGTSGSAPSGTVTGGGSGGGGTEYFGSPASFVGQTLTVGIGGTAGTAGGGNGGNGGTSSWGSLSAPGGNGSPGQPSSTSLTNGAGAPRSNGGIGGNVANLPGQSGNTGTSTNVVPEPVPGGAGGASAFGMGLGGDGVNNVEGDTSGQEGYGGLCVLEQWA